MRYVIVGMGAVGGVLAARLSLAGHEVVGVARGAHRDAIMQRGLVIEQVEGTRTVGMEVADLATLELRDSDVVILTTKSQDTQLVVRTLARGPVPPAALVCLQNGLNNEREALRCFDVVVGGSAMVPVTFVGPGHVRADSAPTVGVVDLGWVPVGQATPLDDLVDAFVGAGFVTRAVDDVMRAKAGKLLDNLSNAIEVVCGPGTRSGPLVGLAIAEAEAVLAGAGIAWTSEAERRERRKHLATASPGGGARQGGSVWQSVARGATDLESDFLNGEVVLLARLTGMRAPVNRMIQRLATDVLVGRRAVGGLPEQEVIAQIGA